MIVLGTVQFIATVLGLVTAALMIVFRRFGPASPLLGFFLFPASLSASALALTSVSDGWTLEAAMRLSFSLLVAAAPLGAIVSYTINREHYLRYLSERRVSTVLMILAAIVLIA